MVFRAQREIMDLAMQLGFSYDCLSRVQRFVDFDLKIHLERGIPPERIDNTLTSLELVDRELARGERDLRRCRELIKRIFRTFGYDNTLSGFYGLDDDSD